MPIERQRTELRNAAFSTLARKLSSVNVRRDAAQIIADIADQLFGWDSCVLKTYCAAQDLVNPLLNIDTIDGRRVDVTALIADRPPTPRIRRLIEQGAELVLRREPCRFDQESISFGDDQRPSASIMGVPIRHAAEVIGILSIYSYQPNSYNQQTLADLQALADHCGAAFNRIAAAEALALSADLFRGAFDFAPIGMALNTPDGRRLKVNTAFCEMVGYKPEELLNAEFQEIMHPGDRAQIVTALKRLVAGELDERREWRYLHKDGHIVWTAISATLVCSPERRPLYVIAQIEDVTKRRRAEEGLKLFRTLIDRSSDAIEVIEPGTLRFLDCNESAHQCLGYSRKEFLALSVFDIDPVYDQAAYSRIEKDLQRVGSARFESVHKRKDGSTFPVEINAKIVRLESEYRLSVVRDITERKRAEERLRQSQSQLAEAQHLAQVGSWNWDVQPDVLTWSDELYCLFGLEPEQIEPSFKAYLQRVHPEDQEFVARITKDALKKLKPFSHSLRIIRADGEVRVFQMQANVIGDDSGSVTRVCGTCQDVTEHKLAEEQLKATSEQLRALSASLQSAREAEGSRIAREIHDDLGAALTSLKWDLEGIRNGLVFENAQSPGLDLKEKLEAMMSLADTTINTVRRISSELRPIILDDLGLVTAIQWHTKQFQSRTGIRSACDGAIADLDFNPEQSTAIFRIFQEALTNVLRHAQASKVEVHICVADGHFILRIKDNGRGITTKDQASVKAFGLMGMRERAHLIGGTIEITGVPKQGTVVTVRVPLLAQENHSES